MDFEPNPREEKLPAIKLTIFQYFIVGVMVALAFGYSDAVSVTTIGAGAITYIVGPVTGAALGADSTVMALSIAYSRFVPSATIHRIGSSNASDCGRGAGDGSRRSSTMASMPECSAARRPALGSASDARQQARQVLVGRLEGGIDVRFGLLTRWATKAAGDYAV